MTLYDNTADSIDTLTTELRDLETQKAQIEARQAMLALELDRQMRQIAASRGEPAARQGRGVPEAIAAARRIAPTAGRVALATAKRVHQMPHLAKAWAAGDLSEAKVIAITRETIDLDPTDVRRLDTRLAQKTGLGELAAKKLAHTTRRIALELDAETVESRRERAVGDRRVTIRATDTGDAMAWLHALLPVEQAAAVKTALDAAADTLVAAGVATSKSQVRADTLVARVTGSDALGIDQPDHAIALNVIMTDQTLLTGSDAEPAWLTGFGPIPATLARDLVHRGTSTRVTGKMRSTLRRLYTHPDTGQLVAMDSKARTFPKALAEFIRLRDQLCATPSCGAPIAHIDHITDWANGGETTADNGQGLCAQCNWAKQSPSFAPPTGSPPALTRPQGKPRRPLTLEIYRQYPDLELVYERAA
ncbi:MAG: HNH endonuclease [Nocardioides sp.]|uniref:HNH endonuclease n=1 Tax=Nocardioides sp. TaxID=35761 RepID=UPI0039E4DD00